MKNIFFTLLCFFLAGVLIANANGSITAILLSIILSLTGIAFIDNEVKRKQILKSEKSQNGHKID